MMLAERVQSALVSMKLTSDEEIIVDRMIAASQRKVEVALPSFGRDLVPYFVPGTDTWNENDVNVNTDVDSFRRKGASLLDIPVPTFRKASGKSVKKEGMPVNVKREKKARSRYRNTCKEHTGIVGMQASLKPLKVAHGDETSSAPSPTSPYGFSTSASTSSSESDVPERESRQDVSGNNGQRPLTESLSSSAPGAWSFSASVTAERVTGSQKPFGYVYITPPGSPELGRLNCADSALLRSSMNEKWAGPAYANSPPPSCLPLPTFACKKITGSSALETRSPSKSVETAGISLIVHSAPASPAPSNIEQTAVLSVDAIIGQKDRASQLGISSAAGLSRRMLYIDVEASSSSRYSGNEVYKATNRLKQILQIV